MFKFIGADHFEGGANLQNQGGTKDHLATILKKVQESFLAVAGVSGVPTITTGDAPIIAAADQSDLPTGLTLAEELQATYNAVAGLANEIKTILGPVQSVAIAAAAAQLSTLALPVDQATHNAFLNDLKAKYNVCVTLLNELKADLVAEGSIAVAAADASPIAAANATDLATSQTLANEAKADLNGARTLINEIKADLNADPDKITIPALDII